MQARQERVAAVCAPGVEAWRGRAAIQVHEIYLATVNILPTRPSVLSPSPWTFPCGQSCRSHPYRLYSSPKNLATHPRLLILLYKFALQASRPLICNRGTPICAHSMRAVAQANVPKPARPVVVSRVNGPPVAHPTNRKSQLYAYSSTNQTHTHSAASPCRTLPR